MPDQLSYTKLVAIYFALCAARKGTTSVVISNDNLKRYFFGKRPGKRLSEKQLTDFADTLRPIFPRARVERVPGPRLILYLNEKVDQSPTKPVPVSFLNEASIRKTLGIQ